MLKRSAKMKSYRLTIAFILMSLAALCGDEEKTISLSGIFKAEQIIGHLGKPLGTIVKVEGTVRCEPVPDEKNPHPKGGTTHFILVTRVDGKELAETVELEV